MRKQIIVLAALLMATGITACSPKAADNTKESVSVEETVENTQGESEGTAEGDETAGKDTGETTKESSGETDKTADESSSDSTEADGSAAVDQTLTDIHEAVMKAYGERYIPSMSYYETELEEMFGVKADWVDSYIAEGPMISVHVETFIAVKAKPGKASDVKKALEDFRTNQIENSMQYPMNMPKLQASQVLEHGDYVFFVMLGSAAQDEEEQGEEAALESAKKDNQIGVDVIENYFKGK